MSLKNLREKIEQQEELRDEASPIVFKSDGKYFTDTSYSEEVPKSEVQGKGLTTIHFTKPITF
ncbi:hypothetical protein DHD05_18885 [Arenibacter sp. N53]|uniref:hypothetical protein n=1 Tax=Arenibacter TaxID=178469 RepID=UPI000CD42AA0|nr:MULTISPECIES: hypothetical protein [Arenibacter]MCM4153663.1 hypothetical protein [Arenibacter sp. N53]